MQFNFNVKNFIEFTNCFLLFHSVHGMELKLLLFLHGSAALLFPPFQHIFQNDGHKNNMYVHNFYLIPSYSLRRRIWLWVLISYIAYRLFRLIFPYIVFRVHYSHAYVFQSKIPSCLPVSHLFFSSDSVYKTRNWSLFGHSDKIMHTVYAHLLHTPSFSPRVTVVKRAKSRKRNFMCDCKW